MEDSYVVHRPDDLVIDAPGQWPERMRITSVALHGWLDCGVAGWMDWPVTNKHGVRVLGLRFGGQFAVYRWSGFCAEGLIFDRMVDGQLYEETEHAARDGGAL
jgi:hypothetical protein